VQRLTRGPELELVRQQGKRVRTASIEARATASLHAFGRVGFVVPRYRQSAVKRNRLKRRLRELVRIELLPDLPTLDVVLRVVPQAYQRDFATLRREILQLKTRLADLA
jgi:ribonuclease P protein component